MNADPNVTFLDSGIIRAATDAAGLHRRCQGERFTRIVFAPTLAGDRWNLNTAHLSEPAKRMPSELGCEVWQGGGSLVIRVAEDRPHPDLPEVFAEAVRERAEAAARLTELVKNLPVHLCGGGLSIPLRPGR